MDECSCVLAGWCEKYSRRMSPREFDICSGRVLTSEKRAAYRALWLRLPGARELPTTTRVGAPAYGPGTELADLLRRLGVKHWEGCGCNAKVYAMNRWGVAGCCRHKPQIVAWLKSARTKVGLAETVQAAWTSLASGLVLSLGVADPLSALVDLAIEKASQTHARSVLQPSTSAQESTNGSSAKSGARSTHERTNTTNGSRSAIIG
jgi:hypothetical protein